MTRLTWPAVAGACFLAGGVNAQEQVSFKGPMDMLSYGIGVETARNLRNQEVDVNLDVLIQGLKDGLSGQPLPVSEKELRRVIVSFQSELRRRQSANKKRVVLEQMSTGAARPHATKLP